MPAYALMRALRPALAAALACAGLAAASAQAAPSAVVGARSPADAAEVAAGLRDRGYDATVIPRIGAVSVDGAAAADVRAALEDADGVAWIEPDRDRTLLVAVPLDTTVDQVTGRAYAWALDTVDGSEAVSLAPAALPVKVAVVDSGVDVGHPDLAGRVGATYDVLTGGAAVPDLVGHGTFIAGLISAVDGNGIGIRGVAGATTILPIRITSTGSVKAADAAAGIVKAVDSGAGVINLSFGGTQISDVEKSALAYAAKKNVLVVAAAGNSYAAGNAVQYPAAAIGGTRGGWGQGLSVAATDPSGRHAPFSTANDFVSVAAPGAGSGRCGDGVFSTLPANPTTLWDNPTTCNRVVTDLTTLTGRYGYGEGTSFSAPLVAGVAALVRDVNPKLTAEQTADVIRRTAHQTQGSGWNNQTGAGVLDADAAVTLAKVYDTAPPDPALRTTPAVGAVTEDFSVADSGVSGGQPSGIASYALERSTDGKSFSAITPTASPARYDETGDKAAGARWFRATVCDVAHNCARKTFGPITAVPLTPKAPDAVIALAVRGLRLSRSACASCVKVSFGTRGSGSVRWTVVVRAAGARTIVRTGAVAAGRPVTRTLHLTRRPVCGGRITVTTTLRTDGRAVRTTQVLHVRRACRPRAHRHD